MISALAAEHADCTGMNFRVCSWRSRTDVRTSSGKFTAASASRPRYATGTFCDNAASDRDKEKSIGLTRPLSDGVGRNPRRRPTVPPMIFALCTAGRSGRYRQESGALSSVGVQGVQEPESNANLWTSVCSTPYICRRAPGIPGRLIHRKVRSIVSAGVCGGSLPRSFRIPTPGWGGNDTRRQRLTMKNHGISAGFTGLKIWRFILSRTAAWRSRPRRHRNDARHCR